MMRRLIGILAVTVLAFYLLPSRAAAQVGAPRVLFTDMDSGPNSGGENNNGTILSVFGKRFGAAQGSSTITIGGGAVAQVKIWSDTKITVAIGAGAQSGPVVVTVNGVASNNTVTFTVRSGNIRCIATNGNDSNSGLWNSCWLTVPGAVHNSNLQAGDIIYVLNGVTLTGHDPIADYSCDVCITDHGGTAQMPIALLGYPNTTAVLGSITEQLSTIRVPNLDNMNVNYWTIADLHIQGDSAFGISGHPGTTGWRVIGNDMYCPQGDDAAYDACFEGDDMNSVKFYGNKVHDVSVNKNPTKLYHTIYWSTDSNHIDAGWNEVGPSGACRGIQFHSSPIGGATGFDQFDLHVHDNYIHDIRCNGINFATVDPSQGAVEAYNNIIVHAGAGPDPPDGAADYACVYSAGTTNTGSPGKGQVKVYNNTMYDCNGRQPQDSGAGGALASFDSGAGLSILAQNNIMDVLSSENYFENGATVITCDHNLFFGAGAPPGSCTNNVTSNPMFTNLGARDFHLQSGSPAIDVGINTGLTMDFDGNQRPIGAGYDLGAYEFTGAGAQQPNPPTNLKVTVK